MGSLCTYSNLCNLIINSLGTQAVSLKRTTVQLSMYFLHSFHTFIKPACSNAAGNWRLWIEIKLGIKKGNPHVQEILNTAIIVWCDVASISNEVIAGDNRKIPLQLDRLVQ
ncbi:hypothetical protein D3C81_1612710 [compost metagenome]